MKIFHLSRVLEFRLVRSVVHHHTPPFVELEQSYENNASENASSSDHESSIPASGSHSSEAPSVPPAPDPAEIADWLKSTKGNNFDKLNIFFSHEEDIRHFLTTFFNNFRVIEAAGGLVLNPNGELLMIHRRGVWDLPKGKVDSGEHLEDAARREVQEETGLRHLRIEARWFASHHIYADRQGEWVLKPTYWYLMRAPEGGPLQPQAEEGIERAEWVPPEAWPERAAASYASLADLMTTLDRCHR